MSEIAIDFVGFSCICLGNIIESLGFSGKLPGALRLLRRFKALPPRFCEIGRGICWATPGQELMRFLGVYGDSSVIFGISLEAPDTSGSSRQLLGFTLQHLELLDAQHGSKLQHVEPIAYRHFQDSAQTALCRCMVTGLRYSTTRTGSELPNALCAWSRKLRLRQQRWL